MQVVRCACAHERPGTDSHHVAGRHDAQGRDRRGHTDTTPALPGRQHAADGRTAYLAGRLVGAVAGGAPERPAAVEAGLSYFGCAGRSSDRWITASRHKE